MAVIAGQRETSNVASTQRVIDLHKQILLLDPSAAPLTTFTKSYRGGLQRERAVDPKFTWHNDHLETRNDQINNGAGYASGATSVVVDNGPRFAVDDLVKVPRTGEVVQVTGISTNTLTIVRAIGGTTAAALVDNDPVYVIGTAAEEGSRSQVARSENPTVVTNYTQIFKHSVEASGTWLSSSNESTPHDFTHQARKAMMEHLIDIEGAFLFGGPGEATGPNGKKQRSTGGLLYFLTSNNTAAGGAWTIDEINTWLATLVTYGSDRKVLFVGKTVAGIFDTHSLNKMQSRVGDDTFGVKIQLWQSNLGEFQIVHHKLLDRAGYSDTAIAVDFGQEALSYKYLNGDGPGGGRDTHVLPHREEEDRDGQKDEILTEAGLRVGLPETGGVVTGATSAS